MEGSEKDHVTMCEEIISAVGALLEIRYGGPWNQRARGPSGFKEGELVVHAKDQPNSS